MPDLSLVGSHYNWFESQDEEAYNIVCMMELIEDWTLDGTEEVETAINKLGISLDNIKSIDLKNKDELITFCAYIKTSRFLSLMVYLDGAYPGAASKLITYAESRAHVDENAALFLKRNIIYERMRMILRVFARERLQIIKASLEDEDHG